MSLRAEGTRPEDYRYWADERVRFYDLDLMGHVNNVAYTIYAESGRAAFLRHIGFWTETGSRQNVIARLEIDYRQELKYPNELRVGLNVQRIGGSSFTLGIGIFAGEVCVATARATLVRFDGETRKALALTESERATLAAYQPAQA